MYTSRVIFFFQLNTKQNGRSGNRSVRTRLSSSTARRRRRSSASWSSTRTSPSSPRSRTGRRTLWRSGTPRRKRKRRENCSSTTRSPNRPLRHTKQVRRVGRGILLAFVFCSVTELWIECLVCMNLTWIIFYFWRDNAVIIFVLIKWSLV